METGNYFWVIKRPEREADHSPNFRAKVKNDLRFIGTRGTVLVILMQIQYTRNVL